MTKWHEQEDFLKLRKEWYDKLEEKGFEDIEHIDWNDGSSGNLMDGFSHMDAVRLYTPEAVEYYRAARAFNWVLAQPPPKGVKKHPYSDLDCLKKAWPKTKKRLGIAKIRKIWALHAEGSSISDIAKKLGETRPMISAITRELANKMWAATAEVDQDEPEVEAISPETIQAVQDALREC